MNKPNRREPYNVSENEKKKINKTERMNWTHRLKKVEVMETVRQRNSYIKIKGVRQTTRMLQVKQLSHQYDDALTIHSQYQSFFFFSFFLSNIWIQATILFIVHSWSTTNWRKKKLYNKSFVRLNGWQSETIRKQQKKKFVRCKKKNTNRREYAKAKKCLLYIGRVSGFGAPNFNSFFFLNFVVSLYCVCFISLFCVSFVL